MAGSGSSTQLAAQPQLARLFLVLVPVLILILILILTVRHHHPLLKLYPPLYEEQTNKHSRAQAPSPLLCRGALSVEDRSSALHAAMQKPNSTISAERDTQALATLATSGTLPICMMHEVAGTWR